LDEFRALLNDLESVYRRLDSQRVQTERGPFRKARRFPLQVDQIQTGKSIETFLAGNPHTLALIGQLLSAIHSYWVKVPLAGGSLLSAGSKAIKMRKEWLEGNKTMAETERINQETIKLARENAANAQMPIQSDREVPISEEVPIVRFDDYEMVAGRLVTRIDRVRRSPRIELMEIDIHGKRFIVSGQNEETLIEEGVSDQEKVDR
jgi:hypothetical protein